MLDTVTVDSVLDRVVTKPVQGVESGRVGGATSHSLICDGLLLVDALSEQDHKHHYLLALLETGGQDSEQGLLHRNLHCHLVPEAACSIIKLAVVVLCALISHLLPFSTGVSLKDSANTI